MVQMQITKWNDIHQNYKILWYYKNIIDIKNNIFNNLQKKTNNNHCEIPEYECHLSSIIFSKCGNIKKILKIKCF